MVRPQRISSAHHALARADRFDANGALTFFDRGMVDAAIGLEHMTGQPALSVLADYPRYDTLAFLVPPWPEIYITDAERQHGFDEAVKEYKRLAIGFPRLGYQVAVVPKMTVKERADFVVAELAEPMRK